MKLVPVYFALLEIHLQGAAEHGDTDEDYGGSSDDPVSCIAQSLMCDECEELTWLSDDDNNCCSR